MNQSLIKTMQIANTNFALLLLRAGAALMMLTHGVPKLMQFFSGEPIAFASVFGMSTVLSLALAVFAEVICSIFILFGLGTRLSSIPLIITMLIAAFHIHGADPFSSKEKSLLFGLIFIVLLLTGAGKYSIDYLLSEKMKKSQ
ncbi:DoxX family protein [Mariniphaga sediminis]|uniref:DoxX family protein n=1 Tax=Mariniphaga sediminis TaxID=1628158 RepID=A0A399D0M0_9BACT|nr:DoxX family protein [Mariniphaga sediminis]RIH63910.1 DoxX family protein [Mariniphaga sediminis]